MVANWGATVDIHCATLGLGTSDDSLKRAGEIKGELAMVCHFHLAWELSE